MLTGPGQDPKVAAARCRQQRKHAQRGRTGSPPMTIRNLDRLFQPRSVALVGASERAGSLGAAVLANMRAGGFRGGIHLINPRHSEIQGLPCAARISDLPSPPDLAVIAAPREH